MVSGSTYRHMFSPAQRTVFVVGAFNPLTFKVIIDMCDPVTVFFVVLGFIFCRSFPSLVFPV